MCWWKVELEMRASGILDFSADLHNPVFTKIAEGAETPDQVEPMLASALGYSGPALVWVTVARQEL